MKRRSLVRIIIPLLCGQVKKKKLKPFVKLLMKLNCNFSFLYSMFPLYIKKIETWASTVREF
jgi:hypothetical protein